MMKSATLQGIFQRVCGRCEQIFARARHFPSELAGSKLLIAISPARNRHRYKSGKVLALFLQGLNAGGTAEKCFSVPNPKMDSGLFILFKIIFYIFERNFKK